MRKAAIWHWPRSSAATLRWLSTAVPLEPQPSPPNLKNRASPEVEAAVVAMAVDELHLGSGPRRQRAQEARHRRLALRRALHLDAPRPEDDEEAAEGTGGQVAQDGGVRAQSRLVALEKAKLDQKSHGEFDSERLGYYVAKDTFYVGTLKGVGRVYQ